MSRPDEMKTPLQRTPEYLSGEALDCIATELEATARLFRQQSNDLLDRARCMRAVARERRASVFSEVSHVHHQ